MTSSTSSVGGRFLGVDGIRAFAVLAVIAAHADVSWLYGGGVGVDVFFGISGFLITFLLLREGVQHGRISLGRFWLRRVLRLYPALLLLVVVVDAVALGAALTQHLVGFVQALPATPSVLFYFSNWLIVGTRSGVLGPFGPLWSLAVEEQFYLVWPLVVLLALRTQRPHLVLASIAGAVSALTVVHRFVDFDAGDVFRTFGTDYRVDMLLGGALLATALHSGWVDVLRRATQVLVVPALVFLTAVAVLVPQFGRPESRGGEQLYYTWGLPFVALSTVAVIGFVVTHQDGRLVRALSWRPLDVTGRISYGLYLWHFPVIFALDSVDLLRGSGPLLLGVTLVLSYLIAGASWRWLESPLQRRYHARLRPGARPAPRVRSTETATT